MRAAALGPVQLLFPMVTHQHEVHSIVQQVRLAQSELEVRGALLSQPYVRMTLAVMAAFGIQVEAAAALNAFRIPRGCYRARSFAIEGDAIQIAFNATYLVDVLKALDGETCTISLHQPLSPITITEPDDPDFIYVVTPVRTAH